MPSYSLFNPQISSAYGAFQPIKAADWGSTANTASGIVFAGALPSVPGVSQSPPGAVSVNSYVLVKADFKPQRSVFWSRPNSGSATYTGSVGAYTGQTPDAFADPVGINLARVDCICPPWPLNITAAAYNSSPTDNSFFVLNGDLFVCTTGGATTTTYAAGKLIVWNHTQGGVTVDNAASWTCYGRASVLRLNWTNNGLASATPTAQDFWFCQE